MLSYLGLQDVPSLETDPCQEKGWIEMTMPEKPSSPKQRFRITPDGRACVEAFEGE